MIVPKQSLRQLDWAILGSALLLCLGGILAINSARHLDLHPLDLGRKQAAGVVLGGAVMIALALCDYEVVLKRCARYLYPLNLVLLLIVLNRHFNHASHGATRWISLGSFQLQPSEFAKIILIGTLALYLTRKSDTLTEWPTVLKSLAHIGVPMLLIAKQPDLGTALVLLAIWFGMMYAAESQPCCRTFGRMADEWQHGAPGWLREAQFATNRASTVASTLMSSGVRESSGATPVTIIGDI